VRAFVITLVVLLALVVGADFAVRAVAEDRVATQLQSSLKLPAKPSVDIGGFPFLTQALTGRYDDVELTAEHIPYNQLRDITLTAQLSGVSLPVQDLLDGRVASIPADTVVASARIDPVDLARVLNVSDVTVAPVTQDELDRLRAAAQADSSGASGNARALADVDPAQSVQLTSTTTVAGQQLRVAVIASFRLSGGQITLSARDIRVDTGDSGALGRLAGSALRSRLSGFSARVDPGQLPFSITATDLRAEDGELVVSGTARDVDLLSGGR
jgi:hypothetical protein